MNQNQPAAPAAPTGKTTASNTAEARVDIQQLTERVYRLFLADLQVQKRRIHGSRR